jgi:hypothetical protein
MTPIRLFLSHEHHDRPSVIDPRPIFTTAASAHGVIGRINGSAR